MANGVESLNVAITAALIAFSGVNLHSGDSVAATTDTSRVNPAITTKVWASPTCSMAKPQTQAPSGAPPNRHNW